MLKLQYLLTAQFIAAATCTSLLAETLPKTSKNPHQISAGIEFFYYQYREPGLMKFKGGFFGFNGAYNFTFSDDFFFQPDVRVSYGRTKYTSNGTGSLNHIPNWLFEPRIVTGKRFKLGCSTQIDPYIGVGYRFKSDHMGDKISTTGHFGYDRKSQYLYIPIGLTIHQQVCHDWFLSPTAEFDWFLLGRQHSHLPGLTIHNRQKHGFGLKGDLMATKKFATNSLSFGPFVNYWQVRKSKDAIFDNLIIWEPRNRTLEAGLKIKYNF